MVILILLRKWSLKYTTLSTLPSGTQKLGRFKEDQMTKPLSMIIQGHPKKGSILSPDKETICTSAPWTKVREKVDRCGKDTWRGTVNVTSGKVSRGRKEAAELVTFMTHKLISSLIICHSTPYSSVIQINLWDSPQLGRNVKKPPAKKSLG